MIGAYSKVFVLHVCLRQLTSTDRNLAYCYQQIILVEDAFFGYRENHHITTAVQG